MTTRRRGASASAPLMPVDVGPRLVLIDGNALVHRSYRAISIRGNLTVASTGEDITGVSASPTPFCGRCKTTTPPIAPSLSTSQCRHSGTRCTPTTRRNALRRPLNCAPSSAAYVNSCRLSECPSSKPKGTRRTTCSAPGPSSGRAAGAHCDSDWGHRYPAVGLALGEGCHPLGRTGQETLR